jgi:N-acetylglucosaminyldiphosphoundecaprenol N-acetyl-beta-D-mannosaminyltransferase
VPGAKNMAGSLAESGRAEPTSPVPASVLRMRVHATTYADSTAVVCGWAERGEARYVCVANVHMVMEAWDDPAFRETVNAADLVTPDGMPLVWVLRRKGFALKDRVYGPTLMRWVLAEATRRGIPVGLLGGTPEVLAALVRNLRAEFGELEVAFQHSPPFRALSPDEDRALVREINASGARILFVGLGCPKQERWMAAHAAGTKDPVQAVMLGVGAAFDFHAGMLRQAPGWMQGRGLEWLFRLAVEPRRLWKRYLKHNPRFAVLALRELLFDS